MEIVRERIKEELSKGESLNIVLSDRDFGIASLFILSYRIWCIRRSLHDDVVLTKLAEVGICLFPSTPYTVHSG